MIALSCCNPGASPFGGCRGHRGICHMQLRTFGSSLRAVRSTRADWRLPIPVRCSSRWRRSAVGSMTPTGSCGAYVVEPVVPPRELPPVDDVPLVPPVELPLVPPVELPLVPPLTLLLVLELPPELDVPPVSAPELPAVSVCELPPVPAAPPVGGGGTTQLP